MLRTFFKTSNRKREEHFQASWNFNILVKNVYLRD